MTAVICITFGHTATDISNALASALACGKSGNHFEAYVVDDCSGVETGAIEGVTRLHPEQRTGYAGVVNFVVSQLSSRHDKLIFVNPDASVSEAALLDLAGSSADLAAPVIHDETGAVENIRRVTSARRQVSGLIFGEKVTERIAARRLEDAPRLTCPPWAPSGAILCFRTRTLVETPMEAEAFWLEMSDWILRRSAIEPISFELISHEASHVGASTSVRYPWSVAASQTRARVYFVKAHGGRLSRALLPLAVAVASLRKAIKRRSARGGMFVLRAAYGLQDWRTLK